MLSMHKKHEDSDEEEDNRKYYKDIKTYEEEYSIYYDCDLFCYADCLRMKDVVPF